MGWTNDGTTTLVIPTGATTGARIVLDGITGIITIYNSSNVVVATLDSAGLDLTAAGGSEINLIPDDGSSNAIIEMTPPAVPGITWVPGDIAVNEDGTTQHRPSIVIDSPNESGKRFSTLAMSGAGHTLNYTQATLSADSLYVENQFAGLPAGLNVLGVGIGATGNRSVGVGVDAETFDRYTIDYDGKTQWGDGSVDPGTDTTVRRSSAGVLATNAQIISDSSGVAETWHTPTFQNGWTGTMKYRKVPSPANCVQITGTAHSPNPFVGSTVLTLPVGYRPAGLHRIPITRDIDSNVTQVAINNVGTMAITLTTPGVDWYFDFTFPLDT